jgi:HEAT repeat protein
MFGPPDVGALRGGAHVRRLQHALRYRDRAIRREAAWSLGTLAGTARIDVEPLARAWRGDPDGQTRETAGWALARLACARPEQAGPAVDALLAADPAGAIGQLLDVAGSVDEDERQRGGELLTGVLRGLGTRGLDLVLQAIRTRDPLDHRRYAAVRVLPALPADLLAEALGPVLRTGSHPWAAQHLALDVLSQLDEPRALPAVLAAVGRGETGVRPEHVARLVDRHPEALPEAARDPDPLVRKGAIDAVAARATGEPDDPLTGLLLAALTDADRPVRARAGAGAGALGLRPAELVPVLPDVLGYPDEDLRLAALSGLARAGEPAAGAELVATALDRSRDPRRRADAVRLLGALPVGQVAEPLIGLLGDAEWMVAAAAEHVLCDIADGSCIDRLAAALPDLYAGAGAAEVLGRIGDARAVEPLVAALSALLDVQGAHLDSRASIRAAAFARALGRLGNPRAVPVVSAALSALRPGHAKSAETRQTAWESASRDALVLVEALGRLGDARAVPALRQWGTHLHDWEQEPEYDSEGGVWGDPPDPWPLETAWVEALRRIGGEEAAAVLAEHASPTTTAR